MKISKAWLTRAVSKDTTRKYLCGGFVCSWRGQGWFAATDGHRIHMHQGADLEDVGKQLSNIGKDFGVEPPKLGDLLQEVFADADTIPLLLADLRVACSMRHERGGVWIDRNGNCGPCTLPKHPEHRNAESIILRSDYVREAIAITRTADKFVRVIFEGPSPLGIVGDDEFWQAVVMPIRPYG